MVDFYRISWDDFVKNCAGPSLILQLAQSVDFSSVPYIQLGTVEYKSYLLDPLRVHTAGATVHRDEPRVLILQFLSRIL